MSRQTACCVSPYDEYDTCYAFVVPVELNDNGRTLHALATKLTDYR